ncbi:MAG TPA: hypothetical protein VHQ02_00365 [Usitatibacter sp.]|jgi:hypothetical protein|nr:hypothetical protein [Usitatibacter sp.]
MRPMQRIIQAGFATAAIASASVPALAWTVWPDVDFEWYANVGKPLDSRTIEIASAPAPSYSWGPSTPEPQPTLLARGERRDRKPASAPQERDDSPPTLPPRDEVARR